jgi:hypothetical protein
MEAIQLSIRIDLETGERIGPGKDRSVRGDPQNRIDHGSRKIDANVLSLPWWASKQLQRNVAVGRQGHAAGQGQVDRRQNLV